MKDKKYQKEYYLKNKEAIKARTKARYIEKRDDILAQGKEYRKGRPRRPNETAEQKEARLIKERHQAKERRKKNPEINKRAAEKTKIWRSANRDRHNKNNRKSYYKDIQKSRDQARAYAKEWRSKNPEKSKEAEKRYRQNNPEKVKQTKLATAARHPNANKERKRKAVIMITDIYAAGLLCIPIAAARAHTGLIEAKREHIKILRELKTTTKKQNAQESK